MKLVKKTFFLILALFLLLQSVPIPVNADSLSFIDNPEAITTASNSVVYLDLLNRHREEIGSGSGFAILEHGVIVTNYHVIDGDVAFIEAYSEHGETFELDNLLAWDKTNDIAILSASDLPNIELLRIGSAYSLLKGSKVIAIGSPQGFINTVSSGICSGITNLNGIDYLQFDAAISHGSSGGALFNNDGEVIGITSASYVAGNAINFAIPIERVLELWEKYENGFFDDPELQQELKAKQLLNSGEFDAAKKIYRALGLADMAYECDYQKAISLFDEEKYTDAIELMSYLVRQNYSDSAGRILTMKKNAAEHMINAKNDIVSLKNAYSYVIDLKKANYPEIDGLYNYVESIAYENAIDYYNAGNYNHAQELLSAISKQNKNNYKNCDLYLALIDLQKDKTLSVVGYQTVFNNLDIPGAKTLIMKKHETAIKFLQGTWETEKGIGFSIAASGALTRNGLPSVISNSGSYYIKDGILISSSSTRSDTNDWKITVISKNNISIYCYKDSKIYSLKRKILSLKLP